MSTSTWPRSQKGPRTASTYIANESGELDRLIVQGTRTASFDRQLFDAALVSRAGSGRLIGLDVGCADGSVTMDRFGRDTFASVLAIDANRGIIDVARQRHPDPYLRFEHVDIEDPNAEQRIRCLLAELECDGVDLAFAGLVLHHLANPIKALRTIRYLLNPGGAVIARSTDDGLKLAFPDSHGRVDALVAATLRQPGVSDRYHGRKLYYQLYQAGFRDITIHVQPTSTVGMSPDQRHNLFIESFSYRRNYLIHQLASRKDDPRLLEELEQMDSILQELELDFGDDSFFYMEFDIAAIGRISTE